MKRTLIVVAVALMILSPAPGQERDVLFIADFEDDMSGALSIDPAAELSITNDPALVFAGEGSLQLDYVQAPMYTDVPGWGIPGALAIPLPQGCAGLGEMAFALRSKLPTPLVIALTEGENGPRYNCLLWSSADGWSEFSLTLDDFVRDLEGPADPNGRLDPELVQGVAIIDGDSIIRRLSEDTPLFHVEPAAEQMLWLDEFVLRSGEPESAPVELPAPLARYTPPMRGFFVIGGRDRTIVSEEQDDGAHALRVDYTTPARTLLGVLHAIHPGDLADCGVIRFHARTDREVTLIVGLEERRGPGEIGVSRYQSIVPLQPSEEFETVTLPLSLFTLGDDQTDPDGALSPELVNMLTIADLTAITTDAEVINTLRLLPPVAVD